MSIFEQGMLSIRMSVPEGASELGARLGHRKHGYPNTYALSSRLVDAELFNGWPGWCSFRRNVRHIFDTFCFNIKCWIHHRVWVITKGEPFSMPRRSVTWIDTPSHHQPDDSGRSKGSSNLINWMRTFSAWVEKLSHLTTTGRHVGRPGLELKPENLIARR